MSHHILCIDTALSTCSVAVFLNEKLIAVAKDERINTASERLNLLIDEALQKANIQLQEIHAIAITNGPGSYTGLRIAAGVAKGIAYALDLPIITLSTLQIMFHKAKKTHQAYNFYLPTIDARRDEIYFAMYDENNNIEIEDKPQILDEKFKTRFHSQYSYVIFGNAQEKLKSFFIKCEFISFIDDFFYDATDIGEVAYHHFNNKLFADIAYFEPNYTKPFFLHKKND